MTNIPGVPPHSLDDMPDEKTYDALVLDHRAGIALSSLAAYERTYRRVLADLADVDRDLAGDFLDETSTLRTYLPYLIGNLRGIQQRQRPLLDRHWATIHQTIHRHLFGEDAADTDPATNRP